MEGRGKSRRRNPYRIWKRRGSGLLAVLLTLSLVLGDISGLSRVVLAGQGTVREEFRIHREDILKAAEEAIENGEPLSEPLAIAGEKEKTAEKYQELLPADGTVYEIFPAIEQVKEADSLELRAFIRLAEGADPASYTLTGDETLVFLYVNGGETAAEGRVNIDGLVSDFTRVEALEMEEEAMGPAASGGAGNGAVSGGAGNSGSGAGNNGGTEGMNDSTAEIIGPEDSASDFIQETEETEKETVTETETSAPETQAKPEDTLPAETAEDQKTAGSQESTEVQETAGSQESMEAQETAGGQESTAAQETAESQESGSDRTEASVEETGSEPDTGTVTEDNKETDAAGSTDEEAAEAAGTEAAEEEKDKTDTPETAGSEAAEPEADKPETEEPEAAEGSVVTLSLHQIQRVAAPLASDSETERETAENTADAEDDGDDENYENTGDPIDPEDDDAEEEEDLFKEKGKLDGKKYDEAVLDEALSVRAFAVTMEDAGFVKEELLEGAHHIAYTVAEGDARLVYTPEYVRDEAAVTFGIIPAEGMEVYQVTANGEALAETEITAAIASASEARRAAKTASESEAGYDEERAVYYQIPQVLEDQDVQVQVVEEGYNDHPAFLQSRTVNGVTVTVSAEEGILPAGTELSVEEVTEQVADAVAQKVEAEAAEEEPVSVTSVLAYDINLMLDGKKLPNSYWEGNSVSVKFSGERIEETTKEADKVEVLTLETPTETVEAAFGETEEMPVVENLTAEDIEVTNEDRIPIAVEGEESRSEIEFDAEHFTIYVISGTQSKPVKKYTMQVGERITVYSDEISYDRYNSPSWKTDEWGVVTILDEGYRNVDGNNRPEATIRADKEGDVTVTVSKREWDWGWQEITDSFLIHVEAEGPKTVTFNGNGATGIVPNPITDIEPGTEITLPGADGLHKNGYSFIGWSKEQTTDATKIGQGKVVIYPAGSEILVNESFTLYAIWVKSSPTDQAVHFFLRLDGVIQNEPSGAGASAYTGHYNSKTGQPAALSGMYFAASERVLKEAKFVTDPTGEAVVDNLNHLPTDQAIVNAINLYSDDIESNYGYVGEITLAEYQKNFRVIWYVVKIPNDPDGYWHVDGVLLLKDQVTLAYDLNCTDYSEGSVTPSGGSYDQGTKVTVAGNSGFSRPGYEFIGWNTEKDGTGNEYQPNDTITLEEDTYLYAQWQNAAAGLRLKKVLEGGNGDVTQVSFSLYKATENWEKASEDPLKTEIRPSADGSISIRLEYDPNNNRYLLYEDVAAPGYQKLSAPIKIMVSFDSENRITYQINGIGDSYSISNPYQIINTYAGLNFAIHKVLVNGNNGTDNVEKVSFQLRKWDESTGLYTDVGDEAFVNRGTTTTEGNVVFTEMPIGQYQLVELTTADGYLLHDPIDLQIIEGESGDIVLQVKENGEWVTVEKEEAKMPIYTVNNTPGAELPETGGPGIIMMERFGWMLLLLAMAGAEIQLFNRKRRKEQ